MSRRTRPHVWRRSSVTVAAVLVALLLPAAPAVALPCWRQPVAPPDCPIPDFPDPEPEPDLPPEVRVMTYGDRDLKSTGRRRIDQMLGRLHTYRHLNYGIELHIIPADRQLTDLPPWRHLKGKPPHHPGDEGRTYDELRGVGPGGPTDGWLQCWRRGPAAVIRCEPRRAVHLRPRVRTRG